MKIYNIFFISISLFFSYTNIKAENIELSDRLIEDSYLRVKYSHLYKLINDRSFINTLGSWSTRAVTNIELDKYLQKFDDVLGKNLASPVINNMLAYFLYTNQKKLAQDMLLLIAREKLNIMAETIESVYIETYLKNQLKSDYAKLANKMNEYEQIANDIIKTNFNDINTYFNDINKIINKNKNIFNYNLNNALREYLDYTLIYSGPWHSLSHSRFIPGNKVIYQTGTKLDTHKLEYQKYIEERQNLMIKYEYSTKNNLFLSVEQFKEILKSGKRAFKENGFDDINTHPSFYEHQNNVFSSVKKVILESKKTLFIDIFLFGGTIGASIANALIDKAEQGVKIYILKDMWNHFGYIKEMMPISNYLRAYSELHPDKMIYSSAIITKHKSGFPSYINTSMLNTFINILKITDVNVINGAIISDKMPLHLTGISDHSKIIIADGCEINSIPRTIIGSKNWTDAAGSITIDDILFIEGPAACITQNNYYKDLYDSLLEDEYKFSFDKTAMDTNTYINNLYEAINNKEICTDNYCKVNTILKPIDPIKRNKEGYATIKSLSLPKFGDTVVRIAENNNDNTITSVIDQNIHLIRSAQYQILIGDQLFYSKEIIDAIIENLKRNKDLKVYIMLDSSSRSGKDAPLVGFPNQLYLDKLYEADKNRIFIKFWFPEIESTKLYQTYHIKNISIDGFNSKGNPLSKFPSLIVGSANKDFLTMSGAFRETQAEVYSAEVSKIADSYFWKRWMAPNAKEAILWDFKMPPGYENTDKKLFTQALRGLLESIYRVHSGRDTLQ